MLSRAQKEAEVEYLSAAIGRAQSLLAIDYRGLTVEAANELRRRLREVDGEVEYRVSKNRLLLRAIEGTPAAGLSDLLTGPTALALGFDVEPSAVAKAIVDFSKDHVEFEIKGGLVDGEVIDLSEITRLAALPSKQELRGMLASTIQAPMRNLAGTLNGLLGNLRNALEQRQQQLGA